jgi:hypothetical protein
MGGISLKAILDSLLTRKEGSYTLRVKQAKEKLHKEINKIKS